MFTQKGNIFEMNNPTRSHIKEAAKRVFLQKGYEGARMRDIAEEAQINKGLLHYYFKSKKRLFMEVLGEVIQSLSPDFDAIVLLDVGLEEKIALFVDLYVETLIKNPIIPPFIVGELQRDPDTLIKELSELQGRADLEGLFLMFQREIDSGHIRATSPVQAFMNIPALCVFPFLMKPALIRLMPMNEEAFNNLMRIRKREVTDMIINSLKC